MRAKVVPLSEAGTIIDSVRGYIRDAWNLWPIPPEYILIVGGPSYIGSPDDYFDDRFGDVTGDYHVELPVGRLPAENPRECSTIVSKILAYENPDPGRDTNWFLKGCTIVREDHDPDDSIYWGDSRALHSYWRSEGYTRIDSLSWDLGDSSTDVDAAGNDGRAFITYRGQCLVNWWAPFGPVDPFTWTNESRLPVVVTASCATINVTPGFSWLGDMFLRAPGGAAAYFGTTLQGNHMTAQRSACFCGFFHALFSEGVQRLGKAVVRGKTRVDSLFHDRNRYEEWSLLGDPEMNIWTGRPRHIDVAFDTMLETGRHDFRVTVTRDGTPVFGAVVCASMDSVVYACAQTDTAGVVVLPINPSHAGQLNVVVTGRNLLPFQGTCRVVPVNGVEDDAGRSGATGLGLDIPGLLTCRPTAVRYRLPRAGYVDLSLLDACGRRVADLIHANKAPGTHTAAVRLPALSPGVYFCRLSLSDGVTNDRIVRKVQLVE
jgi:hypothetical protein